MFHGIRVWWGKIGRNVVSKEVAGLVGILALVLFAHFSFSDSSVSLFSDGFENGFNNWTTVDTKWSVNNANQHTGARSARAQGNTAPTDRALVKATSTSGYANLGLSFWYTVSSFESADEDFVSAEWSSNGGTTWNELKQFQHSDETATWKEWSGSLPSGAANAPGFQLRFRAHLNQGNDQFTLDDVLLTGSPIVPENTASFCNDHNDNDYDGLVDLTDPDCAAFHPTVTVIKNVVDDNDNNGTSTPQDFSLHVSGTNASPVTFSGSDVGIVVTLDPGAYSVTENQNANYTTSYSNDCTGVIAFDEHRTCTVTNDDVPLTSVTVEKVVNHRGYPESTALPSDFTLSINANIYGHLDFRGSATGTLFSLVPGYYGIDEGWNPAYALDKEDYGTPSDCIANPNIHLGEHRTCTMTNNFIPLGGAAEAPTCASLAGHTGWFGQYYNYPWSRDDMYHTYGGEDYRASDDGFYSTVRGEPLNPSDDAYEWYHAGVWGDYFRFNRIDPDLYWGDYFLPFYASLVEEETYGGGRDFHFGVHWSGRATVPAPATYGFVGRLSDSLYIYVNGVLQYQIPGNQYVRFSGAIPLATGDVVDIYYANRTSGGGAAFALRFQDPSVSIEPFSDTCVGN